MVASEQHLFQNNSIIQKSCNRKYMCSIWGTENYTVLIIIIVHYIFCLIFKIPEFIVNFTYKTAAVFDWFSLLYWYYWKLNVWKTHWHFTIVYQSLYMPLNLV